MVWGRVSRRACNLFSLSLSRSRALSPSLSLLLHREQVGSTAVGCRVQGLWCRVQEAGSRVQGAGCDKGVTTPCKGAGCKVFVDPRPPPAQVGPSAKATWLEQPRPGYSVNPQPPCGLPGISGFAVPPLPSLAQYRPTLGSFFPALLSNAAHCRAAQQCAALLSWEQAAQCGVVLSKTRQRRCREPSNPREPVRWVGASPSSLGGAARAMLLEHYRIHAFTQVPHGLPFFKHKQSVTQTDPITMGPGFGY